MLEPMTVEHVAATVRQVAEFLAEALRVDSFADAVHEVLHPLYVDVARGHAAWR